MKVVFFEMVFVPLVYLWDLEKDRETKIHFRAETKRM